jgi:hypothetical protein
MVAYVPTIVKEAASASDDRFKGTAGTLSGSVWLWEGTDADVQKKGVPPSGIPEDSARAGEAAAIPPKRMAAHDAIGKRHRRVAGTVSGGIRRILEVIARTAPPDGCADRGP